MQIQIEKTLEGSILDIGGGGEGVIGRVYEKQVTAIDDRQEELDEAPEGPHKLLMDASALSFSDASFENVTAFYAFMYIEKDLHEKAASEACRVLRPGGQLHIWDVCIDSAAPEPFVTELDILADGQAIHTAYGVGKADAAQDDGYFIRLYEALGLRLKTREAADGHFHLSFEKR